MSTPVKTTLNLDRDLLERARETLGARSFTEAIETALRQAIERSDVQVAWEALVGSELSWESVDDLIDHRHRHGGRTL